MSKREINQVDSSDNDVIVPSAKRLVEQLRGENPDVVHVIEHPEAQDNESESIRALRDVHTWMQQQQKRHPSLIWNRTTFQVKCPISWWSATVYLSADFDPSPASASFGASSVNSEDGLNVILISQAMCTLGLFLKELEVKSKSYPDGRKFVKAMEDAYWLSKMADRIKAML